MSTTLASETARPRRSDWIGVIVVIQIWCVFIAVSLLDLQPFTAFLTMLATVLLMTIVFVIWWLTRRSFTWGQRLLVLAGAILPGVLVGALSDMVIRPLLIQFGLAAILTLWAVWLLIVSRRGGPRNVYGLMFGFGVVWAAFLLVRANGLTGNMRADLHWRWTPTLEQTYLAQATNKPTSTTRPVGRRLALQPGDWPGFRGPGRDGIVHGLNIALDWQQAQPTILWHQRVGPAWSSMAVVDGCVFTQEQRGPREALVCRDALSGNELWAHDEPARFDEPMSGPGPRATPTFAEGRIYAQGAMGMLLCLDASSGGLIWSRDVRADSGAALPMWGFCSSPLVMNGCVITFAGGDKHKGLVAYSAESGSPLWTADAGKVSYSSPQSFEIGIEHQVAIFTSEGLFGVDPANGRLRWQLPVQAGVGVPSVLQACQVGPGSLVLGNGAAFGAERIQVSPDGQAVTRGWATPKMKPSFSDMVYHDGFIYGFDGAVFCCVNAASGDRQWRDGRYGAGQVLLLADQGVMIVTSEDGQAILLRCNPQHNEELGRVQVVSGKTWNHPAIAGDRLFVRSDAEIACVQLKATAE